ncbi:MAG TPA: hypothetical protein VM432_03110 [Bdellovibrionales bacterium]|jgi:hypothetical protein|nr:hypothetical protein [Bdellovibrionales bacterium]
MKRTILASLMLVASAFLWIATAQAMPKADANFMCRDCGFPMRVGENRWKMPNGYVELEIQKKRLPNRLEEIKVILVDSRDGKVLAEGVSTQRQGRKTIDVELVDFEGAPVQGYVRYIGSARREIEVRFTCDECSIAGELH